MEQSRADKRDARDAVPVFVEHYTVALKHMKPELALDTAFEAARNLLWELKEDDEAAPDPEPRKVRYSKVAVRRTELGGTFDVLAAVPVKLPPDARFEAPASVYFVDYDNGPVSATSMAYETAIQIANGEIL